MNEVIRLRTIAEQRAPSPNEEQCEMHVAAIVLLLTRPSIIAQYCGKRTTMNALDPIAMPPDDQLKQAEALAHVQALHDEVNALREANGLLQRELHRARIASPCWSKATTECGSSALTFRDELVRLATVQEEIELSAAAGRTVLARIKEVTELPPMPAPACRRPGKLWRNYDR